MALQISPADLRDMLRADIVGLALGTLLVAVGLLTLALWAASHRRGSWLPPGGRTDAALLGLFAFLYGLRLLARTTSFRLLFDLSPTFWSFLVSAITYFVPLPIFLFIRHIVPIWRRFTGICAIVLATFAVCAVLADAILGRPESAVTPNNVIAVALLAFLVALVFHPRFARSPEITIVRIGTLFWVVTAVADNLRGMRLVAFRGPELEPFGFTVLVACLGTLLARRGIEDARRLVAIDRELSIARQIQSSILPQAMPVVPGLTVVARYLPMKAVAGDFYDFLEVDGPRLGVLVADVSGHGVPAALIASMVKVALAAQYDRADRPGAVLTAMNDTLCGRLAGQYVTAAYLFIDANAGVIRYAAAGHPPMVRIGGGDGDAHEIERNGVFLGFKPSVHYDELEAPLTPGDRLLLYTDGLIEASNASDDLFGLERVKLELAVNASLSASAAVDALLATMDAWSRQPARDDLTVVLLDWDPT